MTPALKRLRDHLSRLKSLFEVLYGLMKEEQKVLLSARPEGIPTVLEKKKRCMEDIGALEGLLIPLKEEIRQALRIEDADNFRLSKVIESLEDPLSQELTRLQASLDDLSIQIRIANEHNASLIRHAMYYNQQIMALLTGTEKTGYDRAGSSEKEMGASNVVNTRV